MKELYFILVFFVLSGILALAMLFAGKICQYKKNDYVKKQPYECGVPVFSDARAKYDIRFFNYAVLFLIFDVEMLFLFPFARNFSQLGLFAVIEGLIFIGILLLALLYIIKRNVLRFR